MQKFVVKKSKSAPLAPTSSQTPQLKPEILNSETNASNAKLDSNESTKINNAVFKPSMTTNAKSVTPSPTSKATHVKMSGYLKKKRNKMGGWRKLWFVLQNQLLLSYSSREDYEKKLAPFKDVLNLMPGTIVRPTKGPRFTIETSINLIYTYRCDNNRECSEWITALVESLGLQSNDYKQASSKLHYSMENLSKTRASSSSASPASSFISSRSCDSIYRSQKSKINPKLPVAQNTARILERTQNAQCNKNDINMRKEAFAQAQNFRLHQTSHANQSFEVYQINRMFNATATKKDVVKSVSVANCNLVDSSRKSSRNLRRRHHHHHHHHHRAKEAHEMSRNDHICTKNWNTDNKCVDKNSNHHSITIMDVEPTHRFDNGNCTLADQIQRISLEDDKNSNLHAACVRKISANLSIASPTLSSSSSMSSGSSGVSNASTASASKFQLLTASKNQCSEDTTDSIILKSNPEQLIQRRDREPIYAVVNLRDKYEHRAKKESSDKPPTTECTQRRERPNSFHGNMHVISGEYEEVLQFSTDCVDDENIYEPINIPELSTKGPLWRYFSKINMDTRWKKEQQQQHGKDETSTTFADLRKRFGQHRKSIKNRVKKLYNRNFEESDKAHVYPNANAIGVNNLNDNDTSGTSSPCDPVDRIGTKNESFSGYFNKRDRYLFSSMLKKSRTSLTFDDAARKKIIRLAAIGGRNGVKHKAAQNSEKNECHSKFYD